MPPTPKRIALVTTVWRYQSHAQHMGDRFLAGYPWEGRWHRPPLRVVSAYVDQRGEGDQSEARAGEFGFRLYPSIAEALRCGTERLAVDGVVIIGEHGTYPRNEKGQILYPRFEFFRQAAAVFEQDGRAAPVFNDKHLSWSFEQARQMVDLSRRLRFPLVAGSSLPVTWRLPPVDLPWGCDVDEALMVGVGSSDAMDFHALEALQCMVERRRGGETGVRAVQLVEGDAVWRAGDEGRWSPDLLAAALARSDSRVGLGDVDGRPQELVRSREVRRLARDPAAYLLEYRDGLRATLLMLNGATRDFTFAARLRRRAEGRGFTTETPPPKACGGRRRHGEPQRSEWGNGGMGEWESRRSGVVSTQFLLPPQPNVAYSACLMRGVEQMILTGRAPYPVERTLLVSGVLERCLTSKIAGHRRLETPELAVAYQAPRRSLFCAT